MRAAPYNQIFAVPLARQTVARRRAVSSAEILDLEFGEEYRNTRFPAGWFLLPSAALAVILIAAIF
jgi:hypothetical protein